MMLRSFLRSCLLMASLLTLTIGSAAAQEANEGIGGFKIDNTKPIEITADNLELRQAENKAIFEGKVDVLQDQVRIRAQKITVSYEGKAASGGKIRNLLAEGGVFITSGTDSAKGAWARYDVISRIITMGGGVTLVQGENVIKGDSLVVNLKSGISRVEGGATGRVKSIFTVPERKKAVIQ